MTSKKEMLARRREQYQLSKRSAKKQVAVKTLAENITRLRMHYRKDMHSDDEKLAFTAMAVAVMDKTAERVGNEESAKNGHFGVTNFKCRHASISGNKVHLYYIGKSGVQQDKTFSDPDIARLMRKRIARCARSGDFIFETKERFHINAEKVNRYLADFDISAKDIRGYLANRFMAERLERYTGVLHGEKERKKAFLQEVKKVAKKVGHLPSTLRKHYLLPNFEKRYIEQGYVPRNL